MNPDRPIDNSRMASAVAVYIAVDKPVGIDLLVAAGWAPDSVRVVPETRVSVPMLHMQVCTSSDKSVDIAAVAVAVVDHRIVDKTVGRVVGTDRAVVAKVEFG
jgi:hypothetical protein